MSTVLSPWKSQCFHCYFIAFWRPVQIIWYLLAWQKLQVYSAKLVFRGTGFFYVLFSTIQNRIHGYCYLHWTANSSHSSATFVARTSTMSGAEIDDRQYIWLVVSLRLDKEQNIGQRPIISLTSERGCSKG